MIKLRDRRELIAKEIMLALLAKRRGWTFEDLTLQSIRLADAFITNIDKPAKEINSL